MYLTRIYQFASLYCSIALLLYCSIALLLYCSIAAGEVSSNVNSSNISIKILLNAESARFGVRIPHFLSLEKIP